MIFGMRKADTVRSFVPSSLLLSSISWSNFTTFVMVESSLEETPDAGTCPEICRRLLGKEIQSAPHRKRLTTECSM